MTLAVTLQPLPLPFTLGPRKDQRSPETRTSHLNPGLRQIDLQSHLLTGIHVRVLSLSKQGLQLLQLASCEGGPFPPLLSRGAWCRDGKMGPSGDLRPRSLHLLM